MLMKAITSGSLCCGNQVESNGTFVVDWLAESGLDRHFDATSDCVYLARDHMNFAEHYTRIPMKSVAEHNS